MRIHVLVAAALAFFTTQSSPTADDLGVAGKDGVVVCTSATACDAGASVLARGGNAVDAAVATAFALAVTHPSAGNIGGGGFMIVRTPDRQSDRVRLSRACTAPIDAQDVPRERRPNRTRTHQHRISRARRARHGSRSRARAQALRQAAVERRRDAGGASRRRGLHAAGRASPAT